jgi:hypothetical protein
VAAGGASGAKSSCSSKSQKVSTAPLASGLPRSPSIGWPPSRVPLRLPASTACKVPVSSQRMRP